jgi:nucleoside transporter
VFFFHGMSPGFWLPAITNVLKAEGLSGWVALVFLVPPLGSLISPLIGGALADQRVSANRLYFTTSMLSVGLLFAAFWCLDHGMNPWWFIGLLGFYSLVSGPSWGLLATITLTHLPKGEKQFPLVRMGATMGWILGGLMTSYLLRADISPKVGYAAAAARLVGACVSWFLPHTPPLGKAGSWRSRLGLDAFSLMKQRDHAVFFGVTTLFSIPLAAFYMYAPEFLKVLGDEKPTATMAIAQVSEVMGMLVVGHVMTRFRVKTVLLWALGLSVLRFAMSSYAGTTASIPWHVTGIALHGVCYTFYFITAQVFLDRRVDPGLRGQAQGLLAITTSGIGPLLGAVVCSGLKNHYVTEDGQGWAEFWGALSAMVSICFVIFLLLYKGLTREEALKRS